VTKLKKIKVSLYFHYVRHSYLCNLLMYVDVFVDFKVYGLPQNLSKVSLILFDKSVTVFNAIYGQSE